MLPLICRTPYFQTAVGQSHNITIDGTNEKGYFKLGYTRAGDRGIVENSQIDKNMVNFGSGYNLTNKLSVSANLNFTNTNGLGRYGTGYDSKNQVGSFRQWWQTNVDVQEQRDAYFRTKQNITWNWADPTDLVPIYWDNIYWVRYENYSTDTRNRYFGNISSTYSVNSWLDIVGRVSLDQYAEIQEERIAVGSVDPSEYSRFNRTFQETNYDLMGQIKPLNITSKLSFNGLLGTNIRKNNISSIRSKTNGGLAIAGVYALANSKSSLLAPVEVESGLEVDGVFGQAGFVYDHWAILDLSLRRDQSSTLPAGNNIYYYPAASLGLIFSQWLPENNILSFGKLRANYAEVGNGAPVLSTFDSYYQGAVFGSASTASINNGTQEFTVSSVKNNQNLKPERTRSYEAGVEMRFMKNRLGFDATVYNLSTINQILDVQVSRSSGYSAKFLNAGEVQNRGIELSGFVRPVSTKDFNWEINVNWARNRNKVVELFVDPTNGDTIKNLQLASLQGGVSVNASLGEAYGTIKGQDFVYLNGQKVVNAAGYYISTPNSDNIIGNVNPDWTAGISNSFSYKSINLGFLIDIKHGGDVFSLDQYYGLATGLAAETAGLNELGNEVRSPVAQGGGILLPGVLADGTPNTKRYDANQFWHLRLSS